MEFVASSITEVVVFLMPGFLAAWIMYGTTSHPKPSQFERVVQALVLTFLVQVLVAATAKLFMWIGGIIVVGVWNEASELIASLLLSISLGIFFAYCINKDVFHSFLREKGFTSRTSHPSEWFYVLSEKVTFVVLHLVDGRRIYGWPKEWPIERGKGQFYIMDPVWLAAEDDGQGVENEFVEGILVDSSDVQFVEFMKLNEETENE